MKDAKGLRWNLKSLGLSESAIDAAWPRWWSDAAEPSLSAQSELRFSLSRKLGLDPKLLLNDEPRFIWKDEAKFKRLTAETALEKSAIASFGASVGRVLLSATEQAAELGNSPRAYRDLILRRAPFVDLQSLMTLCWGIGIPVAYLRVFPLRSKRISAMVVRANGRFAILLARDSSYPAPISFYLAHELGHAALGHIQNDVAVIEFGDALVDKSEDAEENEADRYALELLTGEPQPKFLPKGTGFNAPSIADAALKAAADLRIEPGVIALCFGHSTGAWQQVFSALKMIYNAPRPVWEVVNKVADDQLDWSVLSDDTSAFVRAVLGLNFGHAARH